MKWDKSNSNERRIPQMISEPLTYSVTKFKLDTELLKLHSYKATNSSTEIKECRRSDFNSFLKVL